MKHPDPTPGRDLIVIGGGPAGLIAAGRAAERGKRTLLVERGPSPGRKLLLTGGGRCNITNAVPLPEFLNGYGKTGPFLRTALQRFSNRDLCLWLEARGVATTAAPDGCIFPEAGGAQAVLDIFLRYLKEGGVEIRTGARSRSLLIEDGHVRGIQIAESSEPVLADRVLLATGGLSYPATGSTGDGYDLARQAGHTIVPPYPAVGGLELDRDAPRVPPGITVERCRLRCLSGTRRLAEATGTILWTHHGVSGPAVLDVSGPAAQAVAAGDPVELEFDLAPDQQEQALDRDLLAAMSASGTQTLAAALSRSLPRRLVVALLEWKAVNPAQPLSQLSRTGRRNAVEMVKRLRLAVSRPRPIEEATATGGGVALKEIDPRTMQSRLCGGLYFAGEVLDYYGLCGGYNLQAAISTGRLAADSI